MNILDVITNIAIANPGLPEVTAGSSNVQVALNFFFGLIGAVSVLVVVIAGFQLSISQGEPDKINKARQTILYAIVGVVVAILGSAIINFVITRVG